MLGSSHTALPAVLPILLPWESVRRLMVMQWASLPSFRRMSSVPPSMLDHWSLPPNCMLQLWLWKRW